MASFFSGWFSGNNNEGSEVDASKHGHDSHHDDDCCNPKKTHIELYTAMTPNGHKASITLEELGCHYTVKPMDLGRGEQKEDWYLKINPNGRIPAIMDKTKNKHGHHDKHTPIFESGAIQMWLCHHYDHKDQISFKPDSPHHWEMLEWLVWMNASIGPMQGQLNYFNNAQERDEMAIKRFSDECRRLYGVLEQRLAHEMNHHHKSDIQKTHGPWLVGNKYTIADICNFTWVNMAEKSGIDLEGMDHLKMWRDNIRSRPAVKRGLEIPKMKDPANGPDDPGNDHPPNKVVELAKNSPKGDEL